MRKIKVPNDAPPRLDVFVSFKLRKKKSRQNIGRQIARAEIDPRVFIDLAAKKTTSIRTLLADNLGAFNELRIVNDQGAAFAACEVFCLVKALRRQAAKRPKKFSAIFSK